MTNATENVANHVAALLDEGMGGGRVTYDAPFNAWTVRSELIFGQNLTIPDMTDLHDHNMHAKAYALQMAGQMEKALMDKAFEIHQWAERESKR